MYALYYACVGRGNSRWIRVNPHSTHAGARRAASRLTRVCCTVGYEQVLWKGELYPSIYLCMYCIMHVSAAAAAGTAAGFGLHTYIYIHTHTHTYIYTRIPSTQVPSELPLSHLFVWTRRMQKRTKSAKKTRSGNRAQRLCKKRNRCRVHSTHAGAIRAASEPSLRMDQRWRCRGREG